MSFLTILISMINLPGCIVLPSEVAKKFQIKKSQRLDKCDRQIYFRFDHRLFWSKQKLSEIVYQTTYNSRKKFLFSTVLSPGASKVNQTRKFDDF